MSSYKLTVQGRTYVIEIEDVNADPIQVRVDGEAYEVSRKSTGQVREQRETREDVPAPAAAAAKRPAISGAPASAAGAMVAPMPGTVLEIKVKPGDTVVYGDEIGVLEAMKMKSSLRAERAGTIAEVRVSPGQAVAHGDVLVTFA